MTQLLEKAFREAGKLSACEQDALARRLLAEFQEEVRWQNAWAETEARMDLLVAEAMAERHRQARP